MLERLCREQQIPARAVPKRPRPASCQSACRRCAAARSPLAARCLAQPPALAATAPDPLRPERNKSSPAGLIHLPPPLSFLPLLPPQPPPGPLEPAQCVHAERTPAAASNPATKT